MFEADVIFKNQLIR